MLRETLDDLEQNGKVGDWCFVTLENGDLNLFLRYPVNDPRLGDLPIEEQRGDIVRMPVQSNTETVWQWDGNREAQPYRLRFCSIVVTEKAAARNSGTVS